MVDGDAFFKELLETFRLEAQDHVSALATLLVALENESETGERGRILESVLRRMHTLKGAAHAVNLLEVAKRCQDLEDLLADLKRGELQLDLAVFDRLHADIGAMVGLILVQQGGTEDAAAGEDSGGAGTAGSNGSNGSNGAAGNAGAAGTGTDAAELSKDAGKATPTPGERGRSPRTPNDETVRVSTRLLEALLLQAEELVLAKLQASALLEQAAAATAELAARDLQRSRALDLARESLRNPQLEGGEGARLAALVQQGCLDERQTLARLLQLRKSADKHLRALRGTADPLLEDMKRLHLLPFSSLTDPFAKLVRDLARELDKEADIACSGTEIEIDRRILAELKEPLLHLLRNILDHGIEKGAERRLKGKPGKGRIRFDIRLQDANRAELVIADDGRGIDLAKVKAAALRLELATPEALERISDADALALVFESGVSTSPVITSLSGRGVGLAIVRESLERLGGHVSLDSRPGVGTEFRLSLPLSFSMMRALLVEAGGRACLLPAANVELTARVAPGQIRSVENRDTVLIGAEVLSLVSLARLLELERPRPAEEGLLSVVLLSTGDKRIAFAVDRVAEVQEILVKPLGRQLSRVRNVAGATVLGNGQVVPILNISDLFRSAQLGAASGRGGAQLSSRPKPKRLSVLVAEDSITSRTLLKNILEASGFQVRTAIDGLDAFSQLKNESCDIVISDVEMPRMDGFQLTAAIRADGRWEGLPVVLVTGLESRADRERGIDVGANAYLVKSSFDQGGLVEIIQKLT